MSAVFGVKASVAKSDIAVYKPLRGKVNAAPIVLNGQQHAPRSVQFKTFKGRVNLETGLYEGVYLFEPFSGEVTTGDQLADLNQLPRLHDREDSEQ